MRNSIRQKLMLCLILPLAALSIASAGGSYFIAQELSTAIYDKQLLNSADSVAGRVRILGEAVRLDLPAGAEAIFSNNNKDRFFYQILAPDGRRLAGEPGMSRPERAPAVGEPPYLRDDTVRGEPVRVVTIRLLAPESPLGSVVIQAAETLNSRLELAQNILLAIIAPQLVLIFSAVLAVRIGISIGLRPLNRIRKAVDNRHQSDISPIDDQSAPEEIRSLIKAFNSLLNSAASDLLRQQRFASNAAHQLRTPLAGLKTHLELIEQITNEEHEKVSVNKPTKASDTSFSNNRELASLIPRLHEGVERMIRTVQQLLSLSRAEDATDADKSWKIIDMSDIVTEAATEIIEEAISRKVELEINEETIDTEDSASNHEKRKRLEVYGNPIALKEMVLNLLENAVRYNRPGGSVKVSLLQKPDLILQVEDDGLGIAKQEREKVFERFYRVPGPDMHVTGSGLGLSIVSEIARAHGGSVTITDTESKIGTRIIVRFPGQPGKPSKIE